jgi:hypothetical protein
MKGDATMEWQLESVPARRPGSVDVEPNADLFTFTDPRNEEATVRRWSPVLSELGIEVLGVRDVPTHPVRLTVDEVEWEIKLMGNETYQVPVSVYHIILAAEEHNVPFSFYLWGEEQFQRPVFVPSASRPSRTAPSRPREGWAERWNRALDPILIGVIPTAAHRGVWCKLGAWFH